MARVVVLGSSGFDLTVRLPRLPRPGETLLGGELRTGPGGKGANQAIAARRAGAEVTFLTASGDDDFGRRARENDRAEGIDLTYAKVVPGVANQVALIFVDADGQNVIGVAPGASAHLTPADIDRLPEAVFAPGAVFLASLEVPLETVVRGLERARAAGMFTVLNPAPADHALIRGEILPLVDVLTPNQEEALALTGLILDDPLEAVGAARDLQINYGARVVVVTRGAEGCLVVTPEEVIQVQPHQVEAVDTVGAGDAFNGALAVALAEGRSLVEAAAWANAAGALAVTRPGAQGALPRRPAIDRLAALASGPPRPLE
ncbi:MAG TPA: ribokinase [Isosphaeraceae bacterium]